MVSARQWADDLLHRLGAPVNTGNEEFLVAWSEKEGTKARYNPLATTQSAPGATSFNGIGVRDYADYQSGLDATVKTLRNGNYAGILSGLLLGDANMAAAQGHELDVWGGSTRTPGAYSGSVMSLFRRAQANWPAEGAHDLPSMPGAAGSADTSTLPGGTLKAGHVSLTDVPSAAVDIARGLVPSIGTDIKSVAIFVALLGGALGLILLGAHHAAQPVLPHVNPEALAAVAA